MIQTTIQVALLALGQTADATAAAHQTVAFPSADGLEITADLYRAHEDEKTPFIVLFHQAGWSRGEYREIAPRLNALGFNCLAVDQRSGKAVNGVPNETARRAAQAGMATSYVAAEPDLVAALEYAREELAGGELIAWGSSYSAALVLRVAGEKPGLVDGALSFAPGEYFEKLGKPADWIGAAAKNIRVPVFITSAREEKERWEEIFAVIASPKTSYVPETKGNHGSRALWRSFDDSPGYWNAVEGFLEEHFPRTPK